MHYRSDWPEIGLSSPLRDGDSGETIANRAIPDWTTESRANDVVLRWIARQDQFESRLYDLPVWNLRLEMDGVGDASLSGQHVPQLSKAITSDLHRVLSSSQWRSTYLLSKVVRTEPLYQSLVECGFQEVEERRLYKTHVGQLAARPSRARDRGDVVFTSLADVPPGSHLSLRQQILDISEQVFRDEGHSRHFTDPFLVQRLPGVEYMRAVVALNFERLSPAAHLVALEKKEKKSDRVCGFSVFGNTPGLRRGVFAQLLSATRIECRGRAIYRRMTELLVQRLPHDAALLNVTHAMNKAMQAAYERSGRRHLADTAVMRRIPELGN